MLNSQNLDFYLLIFIAAGILFLLTLSSITLSTKYYKHTIKKINNFHLKEIKSVELVREQIANDLHDAGASLITEFQLKIKELTVSFPQINNENKTINELYAKIGDFSDVLRSTIEDTYPKELLFGHWSTAIESLAFRYRTKYLNVTCINEIEESVLLTKIQATHCYRIIQELITNSIKHSNPNTIIIEMFILNKQINIVIESIGFKVERVIDKQNKGRGSIQIIDRLKYINGKILREKNLEQHSYTETLIFNCT